MFGGVAILAVGIAAVKVIGALFKIPLFNILGETGAADFNNAYSIYSLLLTISTAGLPVALSKMVSEANTLGRINQKQRIFRVALLAFLVMGIVSFVVMWFGGDALAVMMKNPMAAMGIKTLAPAVVCVGCLSAFRGYAQGHMNMVPTTISQIIEALCKLFIGLALAKYIMSRAVTGALADMQTSYAAAGAIAGVTVGTILALIYMFWDYVLNRGGQSRRGTDRPEEGKIILKRLMWIAIPITLSTAMVPIFNVLDNRLVQGQLQDALGIISTESRRLYGSYTAAAALHNLPGSFMTALTASIIPAVSASMARRDKKGSARITASVLRITALVALPMGVGLMVLAQPIVKLLYPAYDPNLTGPLLAILAPASILVCLVLVCNSLLQAYGFVYLPIVTMLSGGIVKVIANYNLVAIPEVNIFGAPVGTLLCYTVALALDLVVLRSAVPNCPNYVALFAKPVAASAVMGAGAWACYGLLGRMLHFIAGLAGEDSWLYGKLLTEGALSFTGNALATLGAIAAAMGIYLALVLALHAISRDDVMLMPKGEKIAKILHL